MLGMQELPFWSSNVGKKGSFSIPRFTSIILKVSGMMPGMLGMRELRLLVKDGGVASCGDDEAANEAG